MWKPRPRLRTFDYIGKYRYFLTFCTHERRRLFLRADVVDLVRSEILRAASARDFAYVVSNPVRAGLAARPEDYPFVGSTTYSIPEIAARCAEVRRDEAGDPA